MENSIIKEIELLIDKKLAEFKMFLILTKNLNSASIETAEEQLAQRQLKMDEIDDISAKISSALEKSTSPQSENIRDILLFKLVELPEEYLVLSKKAVDLKNIITEISVAQEVTAKHFLEIKKNLELEKPQFGNNKRILDFVNSATNSDIFRGRRLDERL